MSVSRPNRGVELDRVMTWLWFGGWSVLLLGVGLTFGIGPTLILLGAHCIATFGMLLKRREDSQTRGSAP